MKKQPPKKPVKRTSKIRPSEPDAPRVAFLYADLGLDQRTIARLLATSIGGVERSVKTQTLVRHQPVHGAWSDALVHELATRLGLPLPDLTKVDPEDVWTKLRVALRAELPKKLNRDPKAWFVLDRFLTDLPHRQAVARDRLTHPRLAFLHGDLGMQAPEIARVLDVSWSAVRTALDREKLHRGAMVHEDLTEEMLTTLARALGREDWPIDRSDAEGYFRFDRRWSVVRKGVNAGLLHLTAEGRLDLAVLDQFLAAIPKLVAERKARLAAMKPTKRTSVPTTNATGSKKAA